MKKDLNSGFKSHLRLKDFLEDEVDESYYLSKKIVKNFTKRTNIQSIENGLIISGNLNYSNFRQDNVVYSVNAVSPTIRGANSNNLIEVGSLKGCGKPYDGMNEQPCRVYDINGICPTLHTCGGGNLEPKIFNKSNIRKLTERECWRLFGFTDEQIDKVKKIGISKTQMYKQAGSSIVINVLEHILYELFIKKHPKNTLDLVERQLTLF